MNEQATHNEHNVNEPIVDEPQEITLRRSQRETRSTISDDYMVYLQESEFDIGIDEDPISFSQDIESINSTKWVDVMRDGLKSMDHNEVWNLLELPKG